MAENYIVRLTQSQQRDARTAGVTLSPWGQGNFLFDRPKLEALCQRLNLEIGGTEPSRISGIDIATLVPATGAQTPDARIRGNNVDTGQALNGANYPRRGGAPATAQRHKAAYVQLCANRLGSMQRDLIAQVEKGREAIKKLREQLVRTQRSQEAAEERLEAIQGGRAKEQEQFEAEFDKLIGHTKVKDVQVEDGRVIVYTHLLHCEDPRSKILHEIGEFKITIYTGRGRNTVVWTNLTRKVKGMNAPHVNGEGIACWGNTRDTFAKLLADYEFASVAHLAIRFVENVNVVNDLWGQQINQWPRAKPGVVNA